MTHYPIAPDDAPPCAYLLGAALGLIILMVLAWVKTID